MLRTKLRVGDVVLRALLKDDIEYIRQWRNAQTTVLRQVEQISPEQQQKYFAEKIWPDKSKLYPKQVLLAIEHRGILIGYGGLVHIVWRDRRAEVSFLLSPAKESETENRREIFTIFLSLIEELAFKDFGLLRLSTETYSHRKAHIRTLQSAGFQVEGCLRAHSIIDGQPVDSLLHAMLASEWKEKK
jgi:RimJ/RimL family protein N-acetyltransferase